MLRQAKMKNTTVFMIYEKLMAFLINVHFAEDPYLECNMLVIY